MRALFAALAVLVVAQQPPLMQDGGETPAVFRRFAGQVVKLQLVEASSGARSVTGTGFYVSPRGHLMTNYHVISELVHEPARYRAEMLREGAPPLPVRVIAIDVVRDLAVVATDSAAPSWFALDSGAAPAQGQRLYSLGHPGDLGIAIVEGTYNGRLPHTLYPRIHFTGSLNPGMSGGPTLTLAGRVVGVNVATAGNQQSFLVPVDGAAALLTRALAAELPVDSLLADAGRQLLAYQDMYLGRLFVDSIQTVALGPWRAPTQPADFFNCWGDADRNEERPYEYIHHSCATDEDVFLSADQSSGVAQIEHTLITTDELNRFQFHALYTREFTGLGRDWELDANGDDEVTGYRCHTGNVRTAGVTAKAVFCARRYKRLAGLYDVVFRTAVIGRTHQGLLSTLALSGVSWENAQSIVRRFSGALAWNE